MSTEPIYSPGLEGVIAGETAISTVTDGLSYRGYGVGELAEKCSFDEVAYLLLHQELPTSGQLRDFQQRIARERKLPEALLALLAELPSSSNSMDVLRSAVSVLGHFDPEAEDSSLPANLRKAERLLAQIPLAVAAFHRIAQGQSSVPARTDLGHAANFLYVLHGSEPNPAAVRALDVALILYAEHEFNASTFTARVTCSTESDLHSSVVAAIGALKGRLHGGANEKVMEILQAAGGPEDAEAWVRAALARKERIMGFGHRVYKTGDERARILKPFTRAAAEAAGMLAWETTADILERVVLAEKGLHPNLDWPAGRLFHCLRLDIPLYTPIFVLSRVAGWSAHVMEQLAHNRLIRPRARYNGPERCSVRPIGER